MSAKSERKRRIKVEKQAVASTPEAIAAAAAEAEFKRRWNTKEWHPQVTDLQLPYVPEHARDEVRNFLAPFVYKVRVRAGDCWWVAQRLTHLADSPRVRYVEGVWTRRYELEEKDPPVPHAWVTVDGYPVCLVGEFYNWQSEDNDWVYEPLNDFSVEEMREALEGEAGANYYDTLIMSQQRWWEPFKNEEDALPKYLTVDVVYELKGKKFEHRLAEREAYLAGIVFKDAIERLLAKYAPEQQAAAA